MSSLGEKLLLVVVGAAVCGGVAGGVVVAFRAPADTPAAGSGGPAAVGAATWRATPGSLPPLEAVAAVPHSGPPTAPPPPLVDLILAGEVRSGAQADARYVEYRKALEARAAELRTLSADAQATEIARIKASMFGTDPKAAIAR